VGRKKRSSQEIRGKEKSIRDQSKRLRARWTSRQRGRFWLVRGSRGIAHPEKGGKGWGGQGQNAQFFKADGTQRSSAVKSSFGPGAGGVVTGGSDVQTGGEKEGALHIKKKHRGVLKEEGQRPLPSGARWGKREEKHDQPSTLPASTQGQTGEVAAKGGVTEKKCPKKEKKRKEKTQRRESIDPRRR